jgi:hypothetical protein
MRSGAIPSKAAYATLSTADFGDSPARPINYFGSAEGRLARFSARLIGLFLAISIAALYDRCSQAAKPRDWISCT